MTFDARAPAGERAGRHGKARPDPAVLTVGAVGDDDEAARQVARGLLAAGLPVSSRQVVDEDEGKLEAALRAALAGAGLVVVLASPGGSAGDIVRRALSRIAGARLVLSDALLSWLERDWARRERAMPHRLDRLALLPQGALLATMDAAEPGWTLEIGSACVAVAPLSAVDLAAMIDGWLVPLALERAGRAEASVLRTLLTIGLAPSDAEDRLGEWLGKPGPVSVSSALAGDDVRVQLLARGATRRAALDALPPVEAAVRSALGPDCYGSDEDTLEGAVGRLLAARGLAVAVADAGTGGLVVERLGSLPDAPRCFERGAVVASRAALEKLGVSGTLIEAHGTVSAPVARAMVACISASAGTGCGLAVTGLAGPGGGTAAKPVGTVFIAAASPAGVEVRRFRFDGGPDVVRRQASRSALDMLRRALLGGESTSP